MEPSQTPFLQLMLNSYDPNSLILGALPFVFLILLGIVIAILLRRRRKEEKKLWSEAEHIADQVGTRPGVEETAAKEAQPSVAEPIGKPAPEAAPDIVEEIRRVDRGSWLKRLHAGLGKTRDALTGALANAFSSGSMNEELLERVHSALYRADIGVTTTDQLTDVLRKSPLLKAEASWDKAQEVLKNEVARILKTAESNIVFPSTGPWVLLVVGVNGVGKTTTIGKLAGFFASQGKKVVLCAGDTFRAAAIDQLQVWGDRVGVPVIKQQQGADPAAVAYDGVKAAIAREADVLIIDTAGRLQNKEGLMAELAKIKRVIGKDLPGAPHETWLVLDATTGQNAVSQVQAFKETANLSGLVVTKLDGTAKGGVVIGIANQFKLPIHFVGVGEKAADLRTFTANDYAESLF